MIMIYYINLFVIDLIVCQHYEYIEVTWQKLYNINILVFVCLNELLLKPTILFNNSLIIIYQVSYVLFINEFVVFCQALGWLIMLRPWLTLGMLKDII